MTTPTTRVTVFDREQYDHGFPHENLLMFMSWFDSILDDIPEEYKEKASFEISSVGSCEDSHYARIEVYYYRPSTVEEIAERLAENEARKAANEKRERDMLAALAAKYGRP